MNLQMYFFKKSFNLNPILYDTISIKYIHNLRWQSSRVCRCSPLAPCCWWELREERAVIKQRMVFISVCHLKSPLLLFIVFPSSHVKWELSLSFSSQHSNLNCSVQLREHDMLPFSVQKHFTTWWFFNLIYVTTKKGGFSPFKLHHC